jgi:hypothetical protein
MSPEDRIRELCAVMSKAEGAELDTAIAELRSILATMVTNADNLSIHNVITFPSALTKRKRA